jgi:hypothetical protein
MIDPTLVLANALPCEATSISVDEGGWSIVTQET